MIKKVKIEDLRVGSFVHDFNCNLKRENLYVEQSYIKNENAIEILKTWGIKEVYIDTDKGLDVLKQNRSREETREPEKKAENRSLVRPQIPLKREIQSANKIALDAVKIVQQASQQLLDGKSPDIGLAYDIANKMKSSIYRNRDALLLLTRIRKKDEYTLYHSINVSSLVLNMCQYYPIPDNTALDMAVGALFHDIGKTLVPNEILNKPGKLNDEEYRVIQRHAEHSVELLSKAKGLPLECYDIALHHHERYNGTGYPHGLEKEQISQGSQITCVCDVFDAITSERCYKSGLETVIGLRKIYEGSGTYFNEKIAHDFIQCIGVYPVGTCVVLADGRSGIVVGSTDDMMRPIVHILYDETKQKPVKAHKVDLSQTDDVIANYSSPKKFGLTSSQLLGKFMTNRS